MDGVWVAEADEEIARCFGVMHQLRPHLVEAEFVSAVRRQMREGYRLAWLEDGGTVVSLGGFRIHHVLWSGKTLYVDDLVTDEAQRSRGYGKAMLGWLEQHARENGCETFSLDSGTHRREAHAFYFREGLRVMDFHFSKKL